MIVVTVKTLAKTPVQDREVLVNEEGAVKVEGDYHPGPEPVAGKILLTQLLTSWDLLTMAQDLSTTEGEGIIYYFPFVICEI